MDMNPLRTPTVEYDEVAVMDAADEGDGGPEVPMGMSMSMSAAAESTARTPARKPKARSLSDGGGTPQKLPPALAMDPADTRRTSKDDSSIILPVRDFASTSISSSNNPNPSAAAPPVTPHRSEFPPGLRGLSLQMPMPIASSTPPSQQPGGAPFPKGVPLSPKLDHSQTYSSPTNILPRRSRGLDFSRAATSLHHTTLAEPPSGPEASPTVGGRGLNIPGRRHADLGAPEQTSNSLWSVMGNHERQHMSTSLGSAANLVLDSSSSSDEDDIMDEDVEEPYLMTPQVKSSSNGPQTGSGAPLGAGSPAPSSFWSFQQRQRPRKPLKKKPRGPFGGVGFPSTPAPSSMLSKSPPVNISPFNNMNKDMNNQHARRESISWAANQLHISGSESEDSPKPGVNVDGVLGPGADGQNKVVRRPVTRRSNMLPKSRNFARVRMALAEEGTPIEFESRREAEVVRQVRESDVDLEPPRPQQQQDTTQSSPSMPTQDSVEDLSEDAMVVDNALGLSSSFKQQAQKNSKGRMFWETFSETSSVGGARTTPPPPIGPRGSSSGLSMDDVNMDSPSLNSGPTGNNGFMFPMTTTSSSGGETPQQSGSSSVPPTAAEITRRFNMGKRRRDDDLDPVSFKRRAVSPGMSVHNSPIMQSPMQHAPWGPRPGSNGSADKGSGSGNGTPSENGEKRPSVHKGRVGFQGMVDTNDGITRLSIE